MVITVLLVCGLLLSAAGVVWGGLNSSTPVLVASLVASCVIACLLGADHKKRIRRLSTAETTGRVTKARQGVDSETSSSPSYFLVKYVVNGKEYKRKARTRLKSQKEHDRYVHKIVRVHYNPNNPKTSWIEIPDVTTW